MTQSEIDAARVRLTPGAVVSRIAPAIAATVEAPDGCLYVNVPAPTVASYSAQRKVPRYGPWTTYPR